jgi:predicted transcriptional regulator
MVIDVCRRVRHNDSRGCAMKDLGPLEAKVMDVLWDSGGEPLRVRDVLERLPQKPARAYTTVMTVLDNLHRKNWVVRHSDGRGYRYLPAQPREQVAAQAMRDVLDSVVDAEAVLMHFAASASEAEIAVLRRGLRRRPRKPQS